eukprot:4852377-Pyramimonas_sp.AAC.1
MGLNRARRLPHHVLTGLGLAFKVPGAPRCPITLAEVVAAAAFIMEGHWSPSPCREHARSLRDSALAW